MLILWGHYYETSADLLTNAYALVQGLVTGPFINNLCQYGVAAGSMAGSGTIDTNDLSPAPATLDRDGVVTQLKKWFDAGMIPKPAVNEESMHYFILPPPTTQLTLKANGTTLKGDVDFCGYHNWDTYNSNSNQPDIFFGIVSTMSASSGNPTAENFVKALSPCISHELAESFTDRDGNGFISSACTNSDNTKQTCEVGDICESKATFGYEVSGKTWQVQQYWSGWDNTCVNGNAPVSVRKFLDAIGFNYRVQGLRLLDTPAMNIRYIASKM